MPYFSDYTSMTFSRAKSLRKKREVIKAIDVNESKDLYVKKERDIVLDTVLITKFSLIRNHFY